MIWIVILLSIIAFVVSYAFAWIAGDADKRMGCK